MAKEMAQQLEAPAASAEDPGFFLPQHGSSQPCVSPVPVNPNVS